MNPNQPTTINPADNTSVRAWPLFLVVGRSSRHPQTILELSRDECCLSFWHIVSSSVILNQSPNSKVVLYIGRQEQAAGVEAAGAYDRKLIAELTRRRTQPGSHKNRCSDANETETFNRVWQWDLCKTDRDVSWNVFSLIHPPYIPSSLQPILFTLSSRVLGLNSDMCTTKFDWMTMINETLRNPSKTSSRGTAETQDEGAFLNPQSHTSCHSIGIRPDSQPASHGRN